jgi:hypothetical protein
MDVKDKYWGYTLWIRLIQEKVCREILRTLWTSSIVQKSK